MTEVQIIHNPTGTIHGDLNRKLLEDLSVVVTRYFDLALNADVTPKEVIGGAMSMLASSMLVIEDTTEYSGLAEIYLKSLREYKASQE